jgi:hypothetical protein
MINNRAYSSTKVALTAISFGVANDDGVSRALRGAADGAAGPRDGE